ncbi:MAG TPA: CDP-alcohol phosphatidyltransferase family protein [Micromonosporaceae bacterium]|jgi:CDP-diacylglycerol--glycerol-3-phosphate 3-phosphatidyltransferase
MAKILGSFKTGARATFDPLGRMLVRSGVSPDVVTIAGTAGVVATSIGLVTRGHLFAATLIITLCCLLDVLDGSMARARGHATRFGALLDSTMDRVADGALFGCLAWWCLVTDQHLLGAAAMICLIGAQLVSYVKARAEGLGFTCNVGIAERMERLILIGVAGLLTGVGVHWALPIILWLLAGLTLITVIQRVVHVRRQERRASVGAEERG